MSNKPSCKTRTCQTAQGPVTLSVEVDDDLVEQMQVAEAADQPQPPGDFVDWLRKKALERKT